MALILKNKYQISIDAKKIFITDITGQFVSLLNEGGWGTSNPNIADICLFAIVIRKDSESDQQMVPVSNQFVEDPTALNTKETSFEFTFLNDGVIECTLGYLPISVGANTVGTLYKDAGEVTLGDYFFYDGKVWFANPAPAPGDPQIQEITDYSILLENSGTINQVLCSDIAFPRLAVEKQKLYKKYRVARETKCENPLPLWEELLKLSQDLQGSSYAFYSTLKIEAQDQIESLINKYQLTNQ